jgi:hypothetical protein
MGAGWCRQTIQRHASSRRDNVSTWVVGWSSQAPALSGAVGIGGELGELMDADVTLGAWPGYW